MAQPKPPAATIFQWLRANLGKRCLAPLTSTDARALQASVQIMELYSIHRTSDVLEAFRLIVESMQPFTRQFAYHAIAMVLDWGDRETIWMHSHLPPVAVTHKCAFEPGGSAVS